MNTALVLILVIIVAIVAIRRYLIIRRRPARTVELCRHIDSILERGGCSSADQKLFECIHLIEHYRIDLVKLNYRQMYTVQELKRASLISFRKHCWRMRFMHKKVYGDFNALRLMEPKDRSKDQENLYKQLKKTVIHVGGEVNRLYLRLTALKFHVSTS